MNSDRTGCVCPPGKHYPLVTHHDGSTQRSHVCRNCPVGTAGTDGTCSSCSGPGEYQDEDGQTSCKTCQRGIPKNDKTGCICEYGYQTEAQRRRMRESADHLQYGSSSRSDVISSSSTSIVHIEGRATVIRRPGGRGTPCYPNQCSHHHRHVATPLAGSPSTNIHYETNGFCTTCPEGSVPTQQHTGCVYCDSNTDANVKSPHSSCTNELAETGVCGPNWIVDPNDNSICTNKCLIPSDHRGYIIDDDSTPENLMKDSFNPSISCDTDNGYNGVPSATVCNNPGEEFVLSGCLPEAVFSDNSKCGDFKETPINLTNRCNELYSNVLENKKCLGEQCNSTSYCCESNVPDEVKNLKNRIYFSDQYELTNKTQAEFDTWYEGINNNIQTLQSSLDTRRADRGLDPRDVQLTGEELRSIRLKDEIMALFNSETSKYYNRDKFKENWIGGGGGQEEISNEVWERLINTINANRETELTSNDNLGDLTPDDIKLLLIKLDMPIKDPDNPRAFKYPTGPTSGLSPLDLFLHNNISDRGITDAQLESLL